MAASSDDSEDENYVVVGTPLPPLDDEIVKKPTTVQDLTATDKQGRRRFHGAFTGGFSAGYFNSVGTKEGFTPSAFVSSRNQKQDGPVSFKPEDFMDDEDLTEYGIAPRKFSTQGQFTSEERKRKFQADIRAISGSVVGDIGASLSNLIVPENLTIGIKLLRKMGWKEGQGLGPRIQRKKKKRKPAAKGQARVYGCAPPPTKDSDSDDSDIPCLPEDVTFAPKDQSPISLTPKTDTHGLGYRGLDPSLALPGSSTLRQSVPVKKSKFGKGIQGQAFGVGAFEDEDEDIYAQDNMSNYDLSMTEADDGTENLFGWTAPRSHGKQTVPVSYVGKLLEGFCLSSNPLARKKKFPPPPLPRNFQPCHWFRKKNKEDAVADPGKLTAVDRGLLLGETPIMATGSVFDLVNKQDQARISSTKEAIEMSQSLKLKPSPPLSFSPSSVKGDDKKVSTEESHLDLKETSDGQKGEKFLSKFTPAALDKDGESEKAPLFRGSLGFQPFRKDPPKQARYDKYLALVKEGVSDPYSKLMDNSLTEWEKSRERDEFSMSSRLYQPMSAMMSARFVQRTVIDDVLEADAPEEDTEKPDHVKAADMKMFGKLTREECEWHPDKLVCKRFNVPNPYPGSDIVGLTTVKRDKYSVFTFLNFGDYKPSSERQDESQAQTQKSEKEPSKTKELRPMSTPAQKRAKMASIFSVLDDPEFNKPQAQAQSHEDKDSQLENVKVEEGKSVDEEKSDEPDVDLFRAIFKNSDSEDTDDASVEEGGQEKDSDDASVEEGGKEKDSDEDEEPKDESLRALNKSPVNSQGDNQTSFGERGGVDEESESKRSATNNRERMSNPFASVFRDSKDSSSTVGRKKKSIFSVLEELSDDNEKNRDGPQTKGESPEMFGPSLPPSIDLTTINTINTSADSSFAQDTPVEHSHSEDRDKRKDRGRQRERSRERTKDKTKSKKSKKKKSKHRKDKKHKKHKRKSSKHKSRTRSSDKSSSGSDADTESSDDD